jgi:maltose-binding protein MalE
MLLAALLAMAVVAAVPAIAQVSQSTEQEAQSGDSTQNFTITGGGANSSSCQGVQGITNTGNATNQTSVLQYANDGAEFEQDDSGNFTISPSSTTTCKTQVNQAASASGS